MAKPLNMHNNWLIAAVPFDPESGANPTLKFGENEGHEPIIRKACFAGDTYPGHNGTALATEVEGNRPCPMLK